MSIRMSSDEKYKHLREQMAESARVVASWPPWMIDQPQRRKFAAKQAEKENATAPKSSAAPLDR